MGADPSYDDALEALNSGRSGDAVSICQRALRENPQNSRCAYLLGGIFLNAGHFASAIAPLLAAFQSTPLNDTFSISVAQAISASGQGNARPFILRALLAEPQCALGHVRLAELSGTSGDWKASVAAATRANIVEPGVAGDLTFQAALAAFNNGQREGAARVCQHILQNVPNDSNAAHLLGLILLEAGQVPAAYGLLRVAVAGKPLEQQLWLHLADAAAKLGHSGTVDECMRRAVLILPGTDQPVAQLAEARGLRGNWASAFLLARRATILDPANPSHRYLHAQCGGALNDAATVSEEVRRAALLSPGDSVILKYLADFTAWRGDANLAERILRRLSRLAPVDAVVWRRLAAHLVARRLQNEAVPLLRRALLLEPVSPVDWQALNEIARNLQDLNLTVKVSRRYAICNPTDADALIHLATAEHALGNDLRYQRVLETLEPLAPRNPSVWQTLALDRRDRGRPEEASQFLDRFFSVTHDRLTSSMPDLVRDAGFISFLTSNLFGGRFDAVSRYCEAARTKGATKGRIDTEIFKCESVAGCLANYFREPVSWSGANRLVVSVPVWGARFADLWIENGLASMLTPNNRRLWERQETVFHIFTTQETWERLCVRDIFQDLMQRHHVRFLNIESVLNAGYEATNYIAMLVAQWTSLCIASLEKADCFSLVADYVFSASAFAHLSDLLDRNEAEAFYTVDFPVSIAAAPLFERYRTVDGALVISERDLGDLFLDHVSERVAHHDVSEDGNTVPTDPSRLNVRLEDGIQIRSMQPQLVYVTKRALDGFSTVRLGATDNGFADIVLCNLEDETSMRMLNDPERFGCAVLEVDEETRSGTGHFARRQKIAESLPVELMKMMQRAGFLTRGRVWALRNPVNVLRSGTKVDTGKTGFLDEVAEALPFASADAIQDIMYDLGRPAFARFLATQSDVSQNEKV